MPRTRDAMSRAASSARTRERILLVARELFAQRGIATTSMEEVAESSGISRPGLIHHFRTKDLLVAAVAEGYAADARSIPRGDQWWSGLGSLADYTHVATGILSMALTDPASASLASHHFDLMSRAGVNVDGGTLGTARAQVAAWEALNVIAAYFPEVRPDEVFRSRVKKAPCAPGTRIEREVVPIDVLTSTSPGYATGALRRRRIIEDASVLFAQSGFHATTLRQLSSEVGITPSTLLHHFGDKARLLAEVLRHRDEQLVGRRKPLEIEPRTELKGIGDEARRDIEVERGLIDLYAVLSTEAIHPSHPAHGYFADRFARTIDYFESLISRSMVTADRDLDPHIEALWLVAMWDGLQYQLILNPDGLDLPEELERHVAATFIYSEA